MTFEALEIMLAVWRQDPNGMAGEFWSMGTPAVPYGGLGLHLKPH